MAVEVRGEDNRFLVPSVIAPEALWRLINHQLFLLIAKRTHEPMFSHKIGNKITVKRPFKAFVSDGRTVAAASYVDLVDESVDILLNTRKHFAMEFNDEERSLDIMEFGNRYLQAGIEELANVFDEDMGKEIGLGLHHYNGTPGTAITSIAVQKIPRTLH